LTRPDAPLNEPTEGIDHNVALGRQTASASSECLCALFFLEGTSGALVGPNDDGVDEAPLESALSRQCPKT